MKCKRILSMLLTLCMVMGLFAGTTVTASAADGATTLYVNGVDTAGGSPAQYATAELKLNGYTAGAALNQATITTTSSTGFKSISLDGFMDKPDGKSDTIGNFSGTKTYYVILKMPRNTGYELQENDGKPVGVTLEGATPEPLSENKDFLIFKMNSKPAAAASTFTDGLGKADCTFNTYAKGAKNDKGYTFVGWFDGDSELENAEAAVAGKTYTAKWTKNGKTVRTAVLDLTHISESNTLGATKSGDIYTNGNEGWSWDATTKTLTLSGATFDVNKQSTEPNIEGRGAILLPANASVTMKKGTENTVHNGSTIGTALGTYIGFGIVSEGAFTIKGDGELSVTAGAFGVFAVGDVSIGAPISIVCTETKGNVAAVVTDKDHSITIAPSLCIKTPTKGKVASSDVGRYIAEQDGQTPARKVVIGVAKKYTVTYNANGGSAVAPVTVAENSNLTAPNAPTKNGYTFHGWYKDAAFTNSWNFDADTVTGNITLYAKWTETTKNYGISGKVYESNGTTPASGVSVKLMKGNTQVASTTSATDGTYSFTGIAPGVYNIVAEEDDTTQTTLVIITNQSETGKDITMPNGKVNSKLTVNGADTPDVVAGGLDKEAAAVKNENSSATLVKVEMTVESKSGAEVNSTDKTNIEAVASGKILEY